jgi:hypothetical protein
MNPFVFEKRLRIPAAIAITGIATVGIIITAIIRKKK